MNKIKQLIIWCKTLKWMVSNYPLHMEAINMLNQRVDYAEKLIRERTDIHADIAFHAKSESQIIMIGRYAHNDYIQIFAITDEAFTDTVRHMRELQQYGIVRKIDAVRPLRKAFKAELHI